MNNRIIINPLYASTATPPDYIIDPAMYPNIYTGGSVLVGTTGISGQYQDQFKECEYCRVKANIEDFICQHCGAPL